VRLLRTKDKWHQLQHRWRAESTAGGRTRHSELPVLSVGEVAAEVDEAAFAAVTGVVALAAKAGEELLQGAAGEMELPGWPFRVEVVVDELLECPAVVVARGVEVAKGAVKADHIAATDSAAAVCAASRATTWSASCCLHGLGEGGSAGTRAWPGWSWSSLSWSWWRPL
jgi:hypothetical protein